eukprot:7388859-Prymnesium_polylepis.1
MERDGERWREMERERARPGISRRAHLFGHDMNHIGITHSVGIRQGLQSIPTCRSTGIHCRPSQVPSCD